MHGAAENPLSALNIDQTKARHTAKRFGVFGEDVSKIAARDAGMFARNRLGAGTFAIHDRIKDRFVLILRGPQRALECRKFRMVRHEGRRRGEG